METIGRAGIEEGEGIAPRYQVSGKRPPPVALAFERGNALLFPDRRTVPSRRRTMLALYRSVTRQALQNWMAGRRRPPQWAIALLLGEIEKRISALEHVRALLRSASEKR
jgi:hypothetical protein